MTNIIVIQIVLVSVFCWSASGLSRGPCSYTTVFSNRLVTIGRDCTRGSIVWHYPRENLTIAFNRIGEFRVCFTSTIGILEGRPRVSFPGLGDGQSITQRVRQFCADSSELQTRGVVAQPTNGYYMVIIPYSITPLPNVPIQLR